MIPALLLVGLALGRRWAIVVGGLGWAGLLLIDGTLAAADVPLAAGLAAVNVGLGVLVHRAIARLLRPPPAGRRASGTRA